jgi:hypothetical protein
MMDPGSLKVFALLSPNKTQKVSDPSVNGTTKLPTAVTRTPAPNNISNPHELTAFVRLPDSDRFERVG